MNRFHEGIRQCLVEHLRMVSSPNEIDLDVDLTTLGLTSMAATNLLVDLEDEFDVQFPDELLTPEVFRTVETLASAICSLADQQASA